jgi:hypothetical protein
MAKANQNSRDSQGMDQNFDKILGVLDDMAESCSVIMPLFSDSLVFSKKIVRMYKTAFQLGKKK